ncbi:MAG: ankyrin repeat domain-containing protein [Saprospiraceae bacterium]
MKNLLSFALLLLSLELTAQNALVSAVEAKNYSGVKKMVTSGSDLNQPFDMEGQKMTVLSLAAIRGDIEMVNLLIQKGAIVTALVDSKDALMFAAKGGNREIVELLLNKGANRMNECKEGTARDMAVKAGNVDISVILENEMQNISNQAKARKKLKK